MQTHTHTIEECGGRLSSFPSFFFVFNWLMIWQNIKERNKDVSRKIILTSDPIYIFSSISGNWYGTGRLPYVFNTGFAIVAGFLFVAIVDSG